MRQLYAPPTIHTPTVDDMRTDVSTCTQAGAVQEWLRRIANEATRTDVSADGCSAADWAALVAEIFPPHDTANAYGHLRLADFTDNVAALPPEARMQAMQGLSVSTPTQSVGCDNSSMSRCRYGGPRGRGGAGGAGAAAG